MSDRDPAFEEWVDKARSMKIEEVASILGIRMPARGEYAGPCPNCGGTDRFSINPRKQVFNCRGAGSGGAGDAIQMVMHCQGLEFVPACEFINNEPPPQRDSTVKERDPAIERERKEERRDESAMKEKQELSELAKTIQRVTGFFNSGVPIEGYVPVDYFEGRGIDHWIMDPGELRFLKRCEYRGFQDRDAEEQIVLGEFPCILAACRNAAGEIQAVHRTYLDARQPIKLKPPGDKFRNKAKKIVGRAGGSLIMLKRPEHGVFAVAEGIESAASWLQMARLGVFGDEYAAAGVGAAYSLGNLCGTATGSVPHPRNPKATIANGEPDMSSAAMWIPQGVKRLVLIGDGDSEPAATRAMLKTGAERCRRLGVETFVHIAPSDPTDWKTKGMDFNDVLLAWIAHQKQRRAAA